ncbi:MAG: hypothetical protein Q4G26_11175 [Paracoccus sp. (in: a-proteobacteria)]|nr:hypothetical protein [Paracoccus sp. (in: a-proteobacteria)]
MNSACALSRTIYQLCRNQFDARALINPEVRRILEEGENAAIDYDPLIDALDQGYFDAEDAGEGEKAAALFSAARLISARKFTALARHPSDYAEAAYEAIMSLPDPQGFRL